MRTRCLPSLLCQTLILLKLPWPARANQCLSRPSKQSGRLLWTFFYPGTGTSEQTVGFHQKERRLFSEQGKSQIHGKPDSRCVYQLNYKGLQSNAQGLTSTFLSHSPACPTAFHSAIPFHSRTIVFPHLWACLTIDVTLIWNAFAPPLPLESTYLAFKALLKCHLFWKVFTDPSRKGVWASSALCPDLRLCYNYKPVSPQSWVQPEGNSGVVLTSLSRSTVYICRRNEQCYCEEGVWEDLLQIGPRRLLTPRKISDLLQVTQEDSRHTSARSLVLGAFLPSLLPSGTTLLWYLWIVPSLLRFTQCSYICPYSPVL